MTVRLCAVASYVEPLVSQIISGESKMAGELSLALDSSVRTPSDVLRVRSEGIGQHAAWGLAMSIKLVAAAAPTAAAAAAAALIDVKEEACTTTTWTE